MYFQETKPSETKEETQISEPVVVQEMPLLFKILSKKENAPLYKACYAVKIKTGDYDGWEKIHAFGEMKGILNPQTSLALYISFTLHSGRGSAYKRIYSGGRLKSLNEEGKSDLLYLYGKFLRNSGRYDSSARYFWMSGSYANKNRSAIETAKTLLISGRKQEACSYLTKSFFPGDESEELLFRICFKNFENTYPSQEFLKAVKILNNDTPDPVFEYFLGKKIPIKPKNRIRTIRTNSTRITENFWMKDCSPAKRIRLLFGIIAKKTERSFYPARLSSFVNPVAPIYLRKI